MPVLLIAVGCGDEADPPKKGKKSVRSGDTTETTPTRPEVRYYSLTGCPFCAPVAGAFRELKGAYDDRIEFTLIEGSAPRISRQVYRHGLKGHGVLTFGADGKVKGVISNQDLEGDGANPKAAIEEQIAELLK